MRIRRATVEDCPELSALALRAKAHWGYADAQLEAWRPILEIPAETVLARPTFVGEIGRQLVGVYQLVPSQGAWELDSLWVAPEQMRRGHGRVLIEHAVRTAAAGGAAAIRIDADPNAEPFYLACGATRVGQVAAPIAGQPDRVRPQLVLAVDRPSRGQGRSNARPIPRQRSTGGQAMLAATCHCGAVRVEIPRRPRSLTNCNCSICRRYGTLWAYYKPSEVRVAGAPGATREYVWGDRKLRFVRCGTCGCITHWERIVPKKGGRMGINARNFEPDALGAVRIRRLDGAVSWKYVD